MSGLDHPVIKKMLNNIGVTNAETLPFNAKRNAEELVSWIDDFQGDDGRSDFLWLCNTIGRIFQKEKEYQQCTDNFRFCRGVKRSERYNAARSRGCCGFYDRRYVNPKTGSVFWIGFNFGH